MMSSVLAPHFAWEPSGLSVSLRPLSWAGFGRVGLLAAAA